MSEKTLIVMGERFEGKLNTQYHARLVNIRHADNHKGLLIMDFATTNGPLPLYCYGDIVDGNIVIRSNMLVGLDLTADDIGQNSFTITAGRRQKKNGQYGNPCVVGITRGHNVPINTESVHNNLEGAVVNPNTEKKK